MHLVLTFLGLQQPNLVTRLLQVVADSSCTVKECHSDIMENISAGHIMATGDWHEIARLENTLKQLELEPGLQINLSRAEDWKPTQSYLPYTIEVYAADRSGILQELTRFLQSQNILITQIKTCRNPASKLMADLFCITISIGIPAHAHIIGLREEFMDFCDNVNIDAILEPVKI